MGKAIQCPTCGRKHRVGALPDAATFQCEECGQTLKVPSQFRPSVMASARHIERPAPAGRSDATEVLRPGPAAARAPAAAAAPTAARPAAPRPPAPAPSRSPVAPAATASTPDTRPIALPLRLLTWVVALILALVVTVWVARVTGWLSGDRLVDVFTGTGGITRYLRVLALAPVWALFTALIVTGLLEGGRALARRRAAARADRNDSRRSAKRAEAGTVDAPAPDASRDGADGDGGRLRRLVKRRGAR